MISQIREKLGELATDVIEGIDMPTVITTKENLLKVIEILKNELGFNTITDITAVDWYGRRDKRFDVVYHLRKVQSPHRIRIKVAIDDGEKVPSIVPIFEGANWLEREVFDMFGIEFEGHPNMKRILLWEGFPGHPLRKDFFWREEVPLPENE